MNPDNPIISWLLDSDVSIQYQVHRDLLGKNKPDLQQRISHEGWGAGFLAARNPDAYWSKRFYQPKWISAHYTLLDIRYLDLVPYHPLIAETLNRIFTEEKGSDGGINPAESLKNSDVCVNGMALNYAAYFKLPEQQLTSVIDFLLSQHMPDGGFNCCSNRSGAQHSSLHTTISVLEGMQEFVRNGYTHKITLIRQVSTAAQEFLLMHRLFRSDHTGKTIHPKFLNFHFPCRWYYDILRALDYLQYSGVQYDPRMDEALEILLKKRTTEGKWKLAAAYPGKIHFSMEKSGQPSRWNTLRALRVLKYYNVPFN